jgi:hypothetical protein
MVGALSTNHLTEIGRVITSWAIVDHALQALCADLTVGRHVDERTDDDDSVALIPFAGMSTRAMVGLIRSMLQVRHSERESEFVKLGKAITEAKAQRDIIAHCTWSAGDAPEKIRPHGYKTVGGLKGIQNEQLTINDMADRSLLNMQLASKVWAWRIRLGYLDAPAIEELADAAKDGAGVDGGDA